MLIRQLDAKPFLQQLQIAQLLPWNLVARMCTHLHFCGKAANCIPSDHALSGQILPLHDKPLIRPRRNPIATIVETHGVHIDLSPLRIMQYKGCWDLASLRIENAAALGAQAKAPTPGKMRTGSPLEREAAHTSILSTVFGVVFAV